MSNDGKIMINEKKNTEDGEAADSPLDIGQQDMLAGKQILLFVQIFFLSKSWTRQSILSRIRK